MDNSKQKLLQAVKSLEEIYYDCMDVFIKEIAKNRKESEDVKNILVSFTELINDIKHFKKDELNQSVLR